MALDWKNSHFEERTMSGDWHRYGPMDLSACVLLYGRNRNQETPEHRGGIEGVGETEQKVFSPLNEQCSCNRATIKSRSLLAREIQREKQCSSAYSRIVQVGLESSVQRCAEKTARE